MVDNAELAQYNPDIQRVALGGMKLLVSAEFADAMLRKRVSKIEGLMCQLQTFPDAGGIYPTASLYLLAQISLVTTHMPVVDHHGSNREGRLSITGNLISDAGCTVDRQLEPF
jgi:hypothetical protein